MTVYILQISWELDGVNIRQVIMSGYNEDDNKIISREMIDIFQRFASVY